MKRLFKTRTGMIISIVTGFAWSIYNLYILGRADQVDQFVTRIGPNKGEELDMVFKGYNGVEKEIMMYEIVD